MNPNGMKKQIPQIAENTRSKVIDRAVGVDSARPRQVRCRHEKVIVVCDKSWQNGCLKLIKKGASLLISSCHNLLDSSACAAPAVFQGHGLAYGGALQL